MERNIIRRTYNRFFEDKIQVDLREPTHCVKNSEAGQLLKVADEFMDRKQASRLRSSLVSLQKLVYAEMEKRDLELAEGRFAKNEGQVKLPFGEELRVKQSWQHLTLSDLQEHNAF